MHPPALCIFDLDGTLVDSLRDVGESVNEALELLGHPPLPVQDYRMLVGEGLVALCDKVIGQNSRVRDRVVELARARYRLRPLRHTLPYPGVREAVAALGHAGVPLAVLSNKPHPHTLRIVEGLWPGVFAQIHGCLDERLRKPDPTLALRIAERAGAPSAEACVIGDTPIDVALARRAGMASVAVTWGFRTRETLVAAGAERIVDTPAELLRELGVSGYQGGCSASG